jgi:hypothetical protein
MIPRQLVVIVREHYGAVVPHTLFLRDETAVDYVYATPKRVAVDGVDSITVLIPKRAIRDG